MASPSVHSVRRLADTPVTAPTPRRRSGNRSRSSAGAQPRPPGLLGEGGRQAAGTYLAATNVTFAIDGVPVSPTMRTAIKPFVGTGIHGQFGISVGALIPPGSIADGPHSLETQITTPDFGVEVLDVTFTLAPDACG